MPEPLATLNEEPLRSDLRELVRRAVEDTLNGLLEAEADDLVGAECCERVTEREAYRVGHCDRGLTMSSGEATINTAKLKGARFATAIIERYRRREVSVEEAMMEMHLSGVSTRRIEDVSEIIWGLASRRRPSPTLTRGRPPRSRSGGTARSTGPTPMFTSTAAA